MRTNVLSEAAAVEKVCPFSRNAEADSDCVGSKCMAWRWVDGSELGVCGMVPPPLIITPTFGGERLHEC